MLGVAYLDYIKYEKIKYKLSPLIRKKIKLKKINGEIIILLHILSEYDFFYLKTVGFVKIITPSRF